MGRSSVLLRDQFTNSQLALNRRSFSRYERQSARGARGGTSFLRIAPEIRPGSARGESGRSAVDQPAVGGARGFHDDLRERRVRMDDSRDLRIAALELARVHELLDQVGRLDRADVGPEQ